MSRFRKKPVVIEAVQWFKNGDHPEDYWGLIIPEMTEAEVRALPKTTEGKVVRYYRHPAVRGDGVCISSMPCAYTMHEHGWIDTPEGGHTVCPGDWVITGIAGEHYPCKPDIFAATYEAVT